MRILITGHTNGLGKFLYEHYTNQGHEVIGVSRSTGYDINDVHPIIELLNNCDMFINNAYSGKQQSKLLEHSLNRVDYIVNVGTVMARYANDTLLEYLQDKKELQDSSRKASIDDRIKTKILHMGISFLPRKNNGNEMPSDSITEYQEVCDVLDHWIVNPCFSDVSFNWKLTDVVTESFKMMNPNSNFDNI